jgi:hypothetical protein
VILLCRLLYEVIVLAAIGQTGTSQAANAFLGPLNVMDSRGFLEVFDRADRPLRNWVMMYMRAAAARMDGGDRARRNRKRMLDPGFSSSAIFYGTNILQSRFSS